jgi:hypothetical protein
MQYMCKAHTQIKHAQIHVDQMGCNCTRNHRLMVAFTCTQNLSEKRIFLKKTVVSTQEQIAELISFFVVEAQIALEMAKCGLCNGCLAAWY